MSNPSHRRDKYPTGSRRARSGRGGDRRADSGRVDGRRRPKYVPSFKAVAGVFLLGCGAAALMVGVAYAQTPIPQPNEAAQAQATIFTYRDGSKLGQIGAHNRISVPLADVPEHVQHAVLAAEDREFYNEAAFSPTGIARALWVDVTQGRSQGASTITQQYVKNFYLSQEKTLTRKLKELFIAVKLGQKRSKPEILNGYLNVSYFGRGTYGVEAASQEYFHTHVKNLTVAQGALLAALIRSPSHYDPVTGDKQDSIARWHYVVDGMVEKGWLTQRQAGKLHFPRVYQPSENNTFGGTRGYLLVRATKELEDMGYTKEQIRTQGLRIRTTFSKRLQRDAVLAVERTPSHKLPRYVETGLVSVKPGTGEVLAMYGGRNYLKHQYDNVYRAAPQAGSAFKPYVLAAALEQDIGLKSRFDGSSPRVFDGYKVHNDAGEQFGMINLITAMQHSVNTVYVDLGLKAGLENVREAAMAAGIPAGPLNDQKGHAGLALGIASLHPIDQAAGYATFAAGGIYAEPHTILEVRDAEGRLERKVEPQTHRAFSEDVAADVTYAMQSVVHGGTGDAAAIPGRDVAGKTGTTQENKAAWFVGFTPRIATAVAMFRDDNKPLQNIPGYGSLYGATLSAPIWRAFTESALGNSSAQEFPEPAWVGETLNPPPPPKPSVEPSPSQPPATPEPTPSQPQVSPPPTRTPEPPEPPEPSGGPGDPGDGGDGGDQGGGPIIIGGGGDGGGGSQPDADRQDTRQGAGG